MKPKTVLWIAVTGALVWLFVPAYLKVQRLESKKQELESEVASLSARNQKLQNELRLLKSDPVYIEHVARKTFNKSKEGEVVYKLVPADEAKKAAPDR